MAHAAAAASAAASAASLSSMLLLVLLVLLVPPLLVSLVVVGTAMSIVEPSLNLQGSLELAVYYFPQHDMPVRMQNKMYLPGGALRDASSLESY